MPIKATPVPGDQLLAPEDHTLILIDFQSQMAWPVALAGVSQAVAPQQVRAR